MLSPASLPVRIAVEVLKIVPQILDIAGHDDEILFFSRPVFYVVRDKEFLPKSEFSENPLSGNLRSHHFDNHQLHIANCSKNYLRFF